MILEAQNCPSAGSFVVGDLDRSGPPDCRASMMASAYVMREVMTIPHSNRVCRSSAVSAQCRDLFADKAVLPASSCSTYTPAPPCLFTKRARRAGRPSNFGANRMHRPSRLCSSRIVVSAAQSPKDEWLLRALRLKRFQPIQAVEHSAPLSSPK